MRTLLDARRRHRTALLAPGPSPQPHAPLGVGLAGVERPTYVSEGRELRALYRPPPAGRSARPALLYLHGGWALADDHMRACAPFVAAGFAVMTPSYRGENGNPGSHEMLWGELDDARAALAWLAAQPEVDGARVYVFGHSAGGMLAMLLSFEPELAAHLCGSVAGIYGPEIFDYQRRPFVDTPRERELRLALPHIEQLEQPHIAFVPRADLGRAASAEAGARARAAGAPLETIEIPGDHHGAVPIAMAAFLDCARQAAALDRDEGAI